MIYFTTDCSGSDHDPESLLRQAAVEHWEDLRRLAHFLIQEEDGARDVVQQAIARALSNPTALHRDLPPLAFLRGLVRNAARTERTRRHRVRLVDFDCVPDELQPETREPPLDTRLVGIENIALLGRALERLPPAQLAAVQAVDLEELTLAEAARKLLVSAAAVWGRRQRAFETLGGKTGQVSR